MKDSGCFFSIAIQWTLAWESTFRAISLQALGRLVLLRLLLCLSTGCAGDIRQSAARVLEPNGGVIDRETLLKHAVDIAQNRFAGGWRHVFNQHVTAQRALIRAQIPYVQI